MILVHYGELGLKGKNRGEFERQLADNIRKQTGGSVERLNGRFVVEGVERSELKKVFGIAWYATVSETASDLAEIEEKVISQLEKHLSQSGISPDSLELADTPFKVEVNRVDKNFEPTSPQIASRIGSLVQKHYDLPVDLDDPDLTIYLEILPERTFLFFDKNQCFGGLPVGITGRALCLLSGGIDSAVAALQMMQRGCRVDFVHFHTFSENRSVWNSKMKDLFARLAAYQPESRVFLVPYYPFQLMIGAVDPGYELMLFRRFMARIAQRLAGRHGYQAIVTGDSLAQVASQTLENLAVVDDVMEIPLFRPLVGLDKQDIIDRAKEYGTFNITIQDYKDCCSIITRRPRTRTKVHRLSELEKTLEIDRIESETLELIESAPLDKSP